MAVARRCVWPLLVALALAAGPAARADETGSAPTQRLVIDRATLEPSRLPGLAALHLYVNALSLEGAPLDVAAADLHLQIGDSEKRVPVLRGRYGGTDGETALAIVLYTGLDYAEDLPVIATAIGDGLLGNLDERTQVAVIGYGEAMSASRLGTAKVARAKLAALTADGAPADPTLLDAVDRALLVLRKARPRSPTRPLRKVILLISDGRDRAPDRDRIIKIGTRALQDDVRILSLAYSPSDTRRPLLGLGELSRRSVGTFRWVRTKSAQAWADQAGRVLAEFRDQWVLTYLVPAAEVATKKAKLTTTGRIAMTSNEVKLPAATCGGTACPEHTWCAPGGCTTYPRASTGALGGLGTWLLVAGAVLGALVLVVVIRLLLARRTIRRAAPRAAGGIRLLYLNGPTTGHQVELPVPCLIGKDPSCQLVVADGYASTVHADISRDPDGNLFVRDRGSTNGTYVDGVRVGAQSLVQLHHGVTIRIGATDLQFLAQ